MEKDFAPEWLKRMSQIIPKKEWEDFLSACIAPLPKTARITSNFKVPKAWKKVAVSPEAYFVEGNEIPVGKTLPHFCGQIYVASLSSLLAVHVLNPQPDETIVDLCAAPGSKTTFLADRMMNSGAIIANEIKGPRVKVLQQNLNRMGVCNTMTTQFDGRSIGEFFGEELDKVLIDAPCSSDGFGRRDPSFFTKIWREKNIEVCSKLQKQLITSAFSVLREGGEMLYSTCTSSPEENEAVVQYLMDTAPEAEILPIDLGDIPAREGMTEFIEQKMCSKEVAQNVRRLYPHLCTENWDSEFFFLARIRKRKMMQRRFPEIKFSSSYSVLKKNRSAEVFVKFKKQFGIDRSCFDGKILLEKDEDIFLASRDIPAQLKKTKVRSAGLKIYNRTKGISTEFAIHFGHYATSNVLELTEEQKEKFLYGYDLPLERPEWEHGEEVMVRHEGLILGHGKIVGNKLKNKLAKDEVFH